MKYKPSRLSLQAFDEFKETVPDADLGHMAIGMLKLFALILKEQPAKPMLALTEDKE